jgi:hypothetical protein
MQKTTAELEEDAKAMREEEKRVNAKIERARKESWAGHDRKDLLEILYGKSQQLHTRINANAIELRDRQFAPT